MYGNGWSLALLSRAAAVLALGLALAWLAGVISQVELEEKSQMSHQALLAQLREEASTPYLVNFAGVLVGTAVYVLLVELLALGLRAMARGLAPAPARLSVPLAPARRPHHEGTR
jgi:hypothetical protein